MAYVEDLGQKPKGDRSAGKIRELLKTARARWKQAEDAEQKQRERELSDLRFVALDQWPEAVRASRSGRQDAGLPATPPRPCLTLDKINEPIKQVLNEERQSDMGLEIVPADDFGELIEPLDDQEIKVREGLVRRIQRSSEAKDARSWAFDRTLKAGRGFYSVMTRFVQSKSWDKEVYLRRFYNQGCVLLDPAHEQPDGSDADWGFVGVDMPGNQYDAEFTKRNGKPNRVSDASDSEWRILQDEAPDWFTSDGEQRTVRVVEYYYTERTSKELALMPDGSSLWMDEVPEGMKPIDTRMVIQKQIKWCKIDGCDDDVLEETDWEGQFMPIVKVLGEELQPYDNERRVQGMTRAARDGQEGRNAMASKLVETVGLTPIPPFQATHAQVEGYEAWYAAATTRTLPYLPYNETGTAGNLQGPPTRTPLDTNISAIGAALQMFDENIQTNTMHDPSLGKSDPSLRSGKAIQAIQQQGRMGSSNFMENLARSMRYEGQIINDLLYPIYGKRPGRLARIINGQGEAETIQLGAPPTTTMPGSMPMPGQAPRMQMQPGKPPLKQYTLTKDANFNVIIKVTRSYDSRREQEAQQLGDLLSAAPMLITWFGDLWFKNQDGPGHTELAERAKLMLDPKIAQMLASKDSGQAPVPPQIQAQMQQGQQQLQQMQQVIQELQRKVETDEVKAKATIEKARIDADVAIKLQAMKDATEIRVAHIQAMKEAEDGVREDREEMIALGQQQAHEQAMQAQQQQHDQAMAQQTAQQQAQMAQQGQQADQASQQAGQQHEAAMAAQQQAAQMAQPQEGV